MPALTLRAQSHTVLLGPARRGPVGIPVRLHSRAEVDALLAAEAPLHYAPEIAPTTDHLLLAARLFFENGGRTLTVVRVAQGDAQPGTGAVLRNEEPVVRATARHPGRIEWELRLTCRMLPAPEAPTAAALRVELQVAERHAGALVVRASTGPLSLVPVDGVPSLRSRAGADAGPDALPVWLDLPDDDAALVSWLRRALGHRDDAPLAALHGGTLTVAVSGGSDGTRPRVADYLGTGTRIGGLDALVDVEDIGLLAAPGLPEVLPLTADVHAVQQAMLTFIERRGTGFVLLATARGVDHAAVLSHRRAFSSSFGALYTPWIETSDGQWTSPCGAVAGCFARREAEAGVMAAPAGLPVHGVRGVATTHDDARRIELGTHDVNVIAALPGRGIQLAGARTLSLLVDLRYIPVRRFRSALHEAIALDLQWVVFEPNGEPLWARVRTVVTNFLHRCWLDHALVGTTPTEAFFVRCDRTTMTADDVAAGRMHLLVGVALLRPAEFHVIRHTLRTVPADGP